MTEDEVTWETCFDCKYSSVQGGMQSCTWKSGRYSCLHKCERFKRDWFSKIIATLGCSIMFIIPILYVIYLILSLEVLK